MTEDTLCPWCQEEECERSCTAALTAAIGTCAECQIPIMVEAGDTCPRCGVHWSEDETYDRGNAPELGPCCICEGTVQVCVLVFLSARVFLPGRGWGCMTCGLPPEGAVAVIYEVCEARYQAQWEVEHALRFVCRGYPGKDGRMPISALHGEHQHRRWKHPELPQSPPLIVVPTDTRFEQHVEEGQGCLCSRCGTTIWEGTMAVRAWSDEGRYQYRYHPVCFGAEPSVWDDPYCEGWDDGVLLPES